jgi:hypothetical protein
MAMNASALKANIKCDLILIYDACDAGAGMSSADFADVLAEAIASRVVEHITGNAEVSTTVTGTAGQYPVAGTGKGKVS